METTRSSSAGGGRRGNVTPKPNTNPDPETIRPKGPSTDTPMDDDKDKQDSTRTYIRRNGDLIEIDPEEVPRGYRPIKRTINGEEIVVYEDVSASLPKTGEKDFSILGFLLLGLGFALSKKKK